MNPSASMTACLREIALEMYYLTLSRATQNWAKASRLRFRADLIRRASEFKRHNKLQD